jgi:hypothetical protein
MNTILSAQTDSSWEEADRLISILRRWGIGYLVGENHPVSPSEVTRDRPSAVALVKRLARCEYPRVRDASISLFLLHPELAPAVLEALQTSDPATAEQIAIRTLATLYLQRLWSLRLTMALGHPPGFPEQPFTSLWRSRHLPPPAYHDGKWGLVALQEAERRRSGLPLNYIGDWQNQVDHLLQQEEAYHREATDAIRQLLEKKNEDEQEFEIEMSMRPNVDREQIENFLKNLGRTFRKPGRLYLVGGAALVHMGLRSGTTQDIDVEVSGANTGEMFNAIRQLVRQMNINVEPASPGNFIPLPSQWMAQSKFIGRYGTVDVFYFDFYSIALTKIHRGTTRDINDVGLLVQQKIITLQGLDAAYQEILPQVGNGPYAWLDPEHFAERYAAVRQLLQGS